jgi:hypothetical protein
MGRACSIHGKMRNKYKILVGKAERKIRLRRPRYRWEDTIRMEVRGRGWEGVHWMRVVRDRDQ